MRGFVLWLLIVHLLVLAVQAQLPPVDPTRQILEEINYDRQQFGAPALRGSAILQQIARDYATELAAAEDSRLLATSKLSKRLAAAGYDPWRLVQGVLRAPNDPVIMVGDWALGSPASYESFLAADLRDFAVGLRRLNGQTLYAVLAAVSADDHFADSLAQLADLAAVRSRMLERVNTARREVDLPPLRLAALLDRAAQGYAEEMFKRGFYGHRSPDGDTVIDRIKSTGYSPSRVGENIASGPETVEVVMNEWLASPDHRANLLDTNFREAGFGVAAGKTETGYKFLWVQCFATPRR